MRPALLLPKKDQNRTDSSTICRRRRDELQALQSTFIPPRGRLTGEVKQVFFSRVGEKESAVEFDSPWTKTTNLFVKHHPIDTVEP